jgi:hypothetical protein
MPALIATKVLMARVNGGNESVIDLAMLLSFRFGNHYQTSVAFGIY